jgi:hypothetical protein
MQLGSLICGLVHGTFTLLQMNDLQGFRGHQPALFLAKDSPLPCIKSQALHKIIMPPPGIIPAGAS